MTDFRTFDRLPCAKIEALQRDRTSGELARREPRPKHELDAHRLKLALQTLSKTRLEPSALKKDLSGMHERDALVLVLRLDLAGKLDADRPTAYHDERLCSRDAALELLEVASDLWDAGFGWRRSAGARVGGSLFRMRLWRQRGPTNDAWHRAQGWIGSSRWRARRTRTGL